MAKPHKQTICTGVIVALLILTAMFLRIMWQFLPSNHLRGLIYFGLFTAWGLSIRRRIIQTQVRRFLTAISALMVFWVVVRTLKYLIFSCVHFRRYLWYFYYFPMLFIPLLVLFVALSLGKPENFRLSRWANCLFLVSATLFVLVLTNDFHQLAFGFPKGLLFFDNDEYSHELIYFLSMGWISLCAVTALAVMIVKCHVPGGKKRIYLPCIPLLALIVYAVLYVTAWDWIKALAGDMTVVSCLLLTGALEGCIRCGLIQSNTHYEELFRITTIRAQISDNDYNILLSTTDSAPLSKEIMRQTETAPILLDDNIRLSGAPIKGGHVMWLEDVSEMTEVVAKLKTVNEALQEKSAVMQEEYATGHKKWLLTEKKRLYNKVLTQIGKNIERYVYLSEQLNTTTDPDEVRRLSAHIAVICAYIKRRINLIFLAEKNNEIPAEELAISIHKDSLPCIRLCGAECTCTAELHSTMTFEQITFFYDIFHAVTMAALDSLTALSVALVERNGKPEMLLRLKCSENLSALSGENLKVEQVEDGWLLTVTTPKEGDAL